MADKPFDVGQTLTGDTGVLNHEEAPSKDSKGNRRRFASWLGVVAGLTVAASLMVGLTAFSNAQAEGNNGALPTALPLSAKPSVLSVKETAADKVDSHDRVTSILDDRAATPPEVAPVLPDTNSAPPYGGGSTAGTTPAPAAVPVWHDGWDEQVWVDTSSYQSIWVGDNPVYEYAAICNECGASLGGFAAQHLEDYRHGSYRGDLVLTGYEPVYENRWVASGYWSTIHHPGYWG